MKKVISLLLALAMCLTLAACGGRNASKELETVANEPPAVTITDHPLLEEAMGEWMLTDVEHSDQYLFTSLFLYQDGTAVVDAEQLQWRIDERSSEENLWLYFYRGSEAVVGAIYYGNDSLSCLTTDGGVTPCAYANRERATLQQLRAGDPENYVMPMICGTWLLTREKENMPREIILKEDYTCTLDGVGYTWQMRNENGYRFNIEITDGSNLLHSGYIFDVYAGEMGLSLDNVFYANPDLYNIVEITPENWLDYFEIATYPSWVKDAFGDTTEMGWYGIYFQLKEEYYNKLSRVAHNGLLLSPNAMEISYSLDKQLCDVDLENQTYTLREGQRSFVNRYTNTYRLAFNGEAYFGELLHSWNTDSEIDGGYSIAHVYDLELVRLACPLYLIPDEYYAPKES